MAGMRIVWSPARWGLRVRSALAAAGVVGVVLVIAAAAMLWLLYRSLLDSVDEAADARVGDIAGQLRAAEPGDLSASLLSANSHVEVVQLIDASGEVIRRSEGAPKRPLVTLPDSGQVHGLSVGHDADLRVSARRVEGPGGPIVVLAAASVEPVEETIKKVAAGLAVGGPVVVVAAAAATYALVGRSLASVEAIRSRVAGIGAERLSERVPVPVARDEIARLATTMNEMLGRLEAGHAAQRRFLSDASHELRSPLATVMAGLELARDHPQTFDRELIGETMLPEAERMQHLIDDLLTLAAADEHGLTLHPTDVDLDDLAATAVGALRQRQGPRVDTDLQPARLVGDPRALARMIRNLTDNAATHARSIVAVATGTTVTEVRLTVDDDGPGIAAADRERVFERFVRLQDDRARNTGGTGLGLAIVAEIVAAHRGNVRIEDSPHGGTRVVVALPLDG